MKAAIALSLLVGFIAGFSFAVYLMFSMSDPLNPVRPTSARPAACWRAV